MAPQYGAFTTPPSVYKDDGSRVGRAERRLRAAEALVRDLQRALADERSLAMFTNTSAARARRREEYAASVSLDLTALLHAYHEACVRLGIEPVEAEVTPLLELAAGEGLSLERSAAMIEGRT